MKKIVSYQIEVPVGNHCWGGEDNEICQFFDNEGGRSSCDLKFTGLLGTVEGWVVKSPVCHAYGEIISGDCQLAKIKEYYSRRMKWMEEHHGFKGRCDFHNIEGSPTKLIAYGKYLMFRGAVFKIDKLMKA